MKKIRVLLADDHLLIRHGLRLLLENHKDFKVVAEASSGQEVLEYLTQNPNSIDIVLMDINMPIMDGVEATQFITDYIKGIKVIALTSYVEKASIFSMLQAGASGYILKKFDIDEIVSAIKSVCQGENFYSNEVSITIINALMDDEKPKSSVLSARELEVLVHIVNGATNKEVGELLFISGRTVETHRRNILNKLEMKNTVELIRYAIEQKLVA